MRESERSLMTKTVFVGLIKETDSGLSLLKLMQFYYTIAHEEIFKYNGLARDQRTFFVKRFYRKVCVST